MPNVLRFGIYDEGNFLVFSVLNAKILTISIPNVNALTYTFFKLKIYHLK